MNIPFKVKKLTKTAKLPERSNEGDLYDLFADEFTDRNSNYTMITDDGEIITEGDSHLLNNEGDFKLYRHCRVLVKTGIAIELPKQYSLGSWKFENDEQEYRGDLEAFAVADIRPRSGLALKYGITVLNTPGTIDNSYRKEIGVILYNAGHEVYNIKKGDKIAQMLIRPLYLSKMEEVEDFVDTGRGAYGSTGK